MDHIKYPTLGIILPADIKRQFPSGGSLTYVFNFAELYRGKVIFFDATCEKKEVKKVRYIKFHDAYLKSIPIFRIIKNDLIPLRLQSLIYYTLSILSSSSLFKDVDAFYIHAPDAAIPFVLFKSKKIIYHMHGATNPLLFSKYKFFRKKIFQNIFDKFINFPAIKKSDLVITINEECQNLVNHICNQKKTFYLPNLVNSNVFKKLERSKCREILGFNENDKIILYVGRLSEVKGLYFLFALFRQLVNSYNHNLKLILVGEGEEEIKLKLNCAELGIEQNVDFRGKVDYEKLPLYYNSCDLFVLASYREGTPMVLLEAMSCSAKIISSNAGNVEKLLTNYPFKMIMKNHSLEEWKMSLIKILEMKFKDQNMINDNMIFSNFTDEIQKLVS